MKGLNCKTSKDRRNHVEKTLKIAWWASGPKEKASEAHIRSANPDQSLAIYTIFVHMMALSRFLKSMMVAWHVNQVSYTDLLKAINRNPPSHFKAHSS